ncbi:Thioredoxin domain protein [Psychromonas ingrahamii 37]|uniref:Thioredoxin domain protein n=1 Tax=Psychromonas ingrahamii (strain DSM 17664 / CCUG 51855 / 37) TaxID=357804 RepID=A1T0W6_PSYIN|nr:thioredoxin family protein [Psychromonas ingrahamii]ABM05381.1 Thioredoxin domain protein [Psychromonas ingrahamii 37]
MKSTQMGFNPDYAEDAPTLEQISALVGDAILEFGVPWCGHCQAAQPAVQEVLSEYSQLPHIKVVDGKGKPLGRAFRVKRWPTFILLHKGMEVARLVRPLGTDEIRELLAQCK